MNLLHFTWNSLFPLHFVSFFFFSIKLNVYYVYERELKVYFCVCFSVSTVFVSYYYYTSTRWRLFQQRIRNTFTIIQWIVGNLLPHFIIIMIMYYECRSLLLLLFFVDELKNCERSRPQRQSCEIGTTVMLINTITSFIHFHFQVNFFSLLCLFVQISFRF